MIRPAPVRSVAPEWLKQAACRADGIDPDDMFPDNNAADIAYARQICAPCPVRAECLADAMATEGTASARNRYGIRAGLTGGQRRARYEALRKQQTGQQTKAAA